MVTELLQNIDRLQWLGVRSSEQCLYLRRLDEEAIQLELEIGRTAEDDLLILDGDCNTFDVMLIMYRAVTTYDISRASRWSFL